MPTKRFKMGHRRPYDQKFHPLPSSQESSMPYHLDRGHQLHITSSIMENEISGPESTLRAYGIQLTNVTCALCSTPLLLDTKAATLLAEQLIEVDASGLFSCGKCHTRTCIGCGMTARASRRSTQTGPCCRDSQLFCLWLWLCALEAPHLAKEVSKPETSGPHVATTVQGSSRPSMHLRKSNGTGYGGHNSYSGAYMGYPEEDFPPNPAAADIHLQLHARRRPRSSPVVAKSNHEQILLPRLFRALKALLPGYFSPTAYDLVPSGLLEMILGRSRAMEAIATLLRTDSFDDMAANSELFCSVLDILARLAHHQCLRPLVLGPRSLYPIKMGLLRTTLPVYDESASSVGGPDEVTPITQLLEKLFHATTKIRHQALKFKDDFSDQEGQKLLKVCEHVDTVYQAVQRSIRFDILTRPLQSNITKLALSTAQETAEWHREHCVNSVDDDVFKTDYHFAKERKCKDQPPKGRMKRLLTEITTLHSALPEGIFVRYASSRPDLMKVLIIGPRGTPYEQGVFEFDLVCPLNYPQASPKMQFKTTGKGTAHFNPNLYPDGKVCLSLLGTWSGPTWVPKESTILQVLVSIQAMIFCSEPWYNEPGRESREMEDQSKRFNVEVQTLTIRHALTSVLSQSQKHGCWQEVIDRHFRMHGIEILETLKDWQRKAAKIPDRVPKRFPNAPMPMIPQQPFQSALPTSMASPTYLPPGGFHTSPMAPGTTWQSAGWPPMAPNFLPHPHYSTSNVKTSLGASFASLANHYHSPLVLPNPGKNSYKVDPMIPTKFHDVLQDVATATGLPLVVSFDEYMPVVPQNTAVPPLGDSFYSNMFQKVLAMSYSSLPSSNMGPTIPHQSIQHFQHQAVAPNPKIYANNAIEHGPKHTGVDFTQNQGVLQQTNAMLTKASSDIKLAVPQKGESSVISSSLTAAVPALETGTVPAMPSIPLECFTDETPILLTEWLEDVMSQHHSVKKNLLPSTPTYVAFESMQIELLKKASANKWNKTFTLEDFPESTSFSDSDLDDDISIYGAIQGEIGLHKEMEKFEKALKDYLREDGEKSPL